MQVNNPNKYIKSYSIFAHCEFEIPEKVIPGITAKVDYQVILGKGANDNWIIEAIEPQEFVWLQVFGKRFNEYKEYGSVVKSLEKDFGIDLWDKITEYVTPKIDIKHILFTLKKQLNENN